MTRAIRLLRGRKIKTAVLFTRLLKSLGGDRIGHQELTTAGSVSFF